MICLIPRTLWSRFLVVTLVVRLWPLSLFSLAESITSTPLTKRPSNGGALFQQILPEQSGMDWVPVFPLKAGLEALQDQRSGMGVATGDIDNDGYPDIYISNYNHGNRLYRNLGNWKFEEIAEAAGVTGEGRWCGGVSFVDIDNDGDLDIYVAAFNAPNLLYINEGNLKFREAAQEFGLAFAGASVMMAFADIDRDGDLDGYLLTARLALDSRQGLPRSANDALKRGLLRVHLSGAIEITPAFKELFETIKKPNGRDELILAGQRDRLFLNEGKRFRDVTTDFGIVGNDIGLAATWWDYDDDGYPDLYVSNDYKGPDRLYRNRGGARFEEVTATALDSVPYASMGTDFADVNNDGLMDLFATDMAGSTRSREIMNYSDLARDIWFLQSAEPRQYRRNMLYLNSGTDRFFESAYFAGIARTDWTWSPKFGDFDNDGWSDLFVANGMSRDFVNRDTANQVSLKGDEGWLSTAMLLETNMAFRNTGTGRFEELAAEWGLNLQSASYGAALADFDRDGNLDLVVSNFNAPLALYKNQGGGNSSILLRLRGQTSNQWGIGARVELWWEGKKQVQQLSLARGFMSANEPILHFGCGKASRVERLRIRWPNGSEQEFNNLETDRFYTVREEGTKPKATPTVTAPVFARSSLTTNLFHVENDFDDFTLQPLLPFKMSELGPGLSMGDVDGDGSADLYLPGPAGQSGRVYRRTASGFMLKTQAALQSDALFEDLGCLFFDTDADGDQDLYVVSGGLEIYGRSDLLQDRLYLNNGKGEFSRSKPDAIPLEIASGGPVSAADFDRDGDLDLLVGGRVVPGRYPQAPPSMLLQNQGGKFVKVEIPVLETAGMVTGALWSDVNNDGWIDLLLTREWGSPMLLKNREGQLEDATTEAGLDGLTGLWNSITGADLDNDGDIDYVLGNLGLNSMYRASPRKPLVLLFGDFERRSQVDLLEADYEGDQLFPVRGKAVLTEAFPTFLARYRTFSDFGRATVQDIFGDYLLSQSPRMEVACLSSGILINDGAGKFTFQPLPMMAQLAPVFGLLAQDFDADGRVDICLAQNLSGVRPETGRMRGGLGALLLGDGTGGFRELSPAKSGLALPGDHRAMVVTDLNDDQWPDLLVTSRQASVLSFTTLPVPGRGMLSVRLLSADPGNRAGVGARVSAVYSDGSQRTAEVYAGNGYLSQGEPRLFFGIPQGLTCRELVVRWPNGQVQRVPSERKPTMLIKQG